VARYTGPVDRLSRREGRDLKLKGERYHKGKSPMQKRPFPPGQITTGARRNKQSTYALMLREKQTAKRMYGILERQFRRYFQIADRYRGITGETLLQLLERRLDNVVYRCGFAGTRPAARQLVAHGRVRVNGKKVDIPSCLVNPGDEITLKPKALENNDVVVSLDSIERRHARKSWIEFNHDKKSAKFIHIPSRQEMDDVDVKEQLIVELYSR
jgi:small subunit ribosomal protein S4